jgi:copper homeostasis protein
MAGQTKYTLEVCAFNIQSCLVAQRVGAARVELCADPLQGGTTPAYGLIRAARELLTIQLYPIIRPREGDFCYDEYDYAIIKRDIEMCKEIGCDGISIGMQLSDGEVDKARLKEIVTLANPMKVTFHRSFDTTPNAFKALEEIIACGCERILTSGQKSNAADATDMIGKLVQAAGNRISIMPGSGVRASNIEQLKNTGAKEFHTSARVQPQPSSIDIKLFDPGKFFISDEQELKNIIAQLQ